MCGNKIHEEFYKLAEEVMSFGSKFKGRLSEELLCGALNYVEYGENRIAFETLLSYLVDCNIILDSIEWSVLLAIAGKLGIDETDLDIAYLKKISN